MPPVRPDEIPAATVARLPGYLRALRLLRHPTTSSTELADLAGGAPAQVRRDLSYFGTFGTRGVGYDVAALRSAIIEVLGMSETWRVVLVGVGNLGTALLRQYTREGRPFQVVAAVDSSPELVGTERDGLTIRAQNELRAVVRESGATMAIVTTPAAAAQGVVDSLVDAGIGSILNFAPAVLSVPEDVELRSVDLTSELQILAYGQLHRQ